MRLKLLISECQSKKSLLVTLELLPPFRSPWTLGAQLHMPRDWSATSDNHVLLRKNILLDQFWCLLAVTVKLIAKSPFAHTCTETSLMELYVCHLLNPVSYTGILSYQYLEKPVHWFPLEHGLRRNLKGQLQDVHLKTSHHGLQSTVFCGPWLSSGNVLQKTFTCLAFLLQHRLCNLTLTSLIPSGTAVQKLQAVIWCSLRTNKEGRGTYLYNWN